MSAELRTAVLLVFFLAGSVALAGPRDGRTPAEESTCDELRGATPGLYGLCVAYCEAQDCPMTVDSNPAKCSRILANYRKKMRANDPDMPCVRPPGPWTASLVSGNGPEGRDPTSIALSSPSGTALDSLGNLYVADRRNYRVLRVSPSGVMARIAGTGERCPEANSDPCGDGGPATSARFGEIWGIAVDSWGHVYVSDTRRDRVRKIDAVTRYIETVVNTDGAQCAFPSSSAACGDGGTAGAADLHGPHGLAVDSQDRLYIADRSDYRVRRVSTHHSSGPVEQLSTIETVVGSGIPCHSGSCGDGSPATDARTTPLDVAVYDDGVDVRVYIANNVHGAERVREAIVGGYIDEFAGNASSGIFEDCSDATAFQLQLPSAVDVDASGNVYITEGPTDNVSRVDYSTRRLCRVAGHWGHHGDLNDGGPGCDATIHSPVDVTVDRFSNDLFIADAGHHRIRKLAASNETIYECQNPNSDDNLIRTVLGNGGFGFFGEGNPAHAAPLKLPLGLAIDDGGNIFIGDAGADFCRIRRIDATTNVITTIAGTGEKGDSGDNGDDALTATFRLPYGIAVDSNGNVFVADLQAQIIRKITPDGKIWTVAGVAGEYGFDGDTPRLAVGARLDDPRYLAVDGHNNLYLSSSSNDRVRRIDAVGGEVDPASSMITTVAGGGASTDYDNPAGVPIEEIRLARPSGLAVSADNTLYVGNRSGSGAYRVFGIPDAHTANVQNTGSHAVFSIAGSASRCPPASTSGFNTCGDGGPASSAMLGSPEGLAYDSATGDIYIGDSLIWRVRRIWDNAGEWYIEGVAGNSLGASGNRFSGDGGPAVDARLYSVTSVAVDPSGNVLFADQRNANVRQVDVATGIITTVAGAVFPYGDRELHFSNLAAPHALARMSDTEWLVADGWSRRVRLVDPTPGIGSVSSVAGYPSGFSDDDVPALYSRMLDNPTGVAYDGTRFIYVAETDNHVIRRIDTSLSPWTIEHWAGTEGIAGMLSSPGGLAIDNVRSLLYVADTGNHVVRSIDLANPTQIETVAGVVGDEGGCATDAGDATGALATRLQEPVALAMDSTGNDSLFVVDAGCHMVRRIDLSSLPPQSTRVIGDGTNGDPGDGVASTVLLSGPRGAAVDSTGNLFVTSRAHVMIVSSGDDRRADEGDSVEVIYGAEPSTDELQPLTRCLTDVAIAHPGDGTENEVYVLDRCAGFMLRLQAGLLP